MTIFQWKLGAAVALTGGLLLSAKAVAQDLEPEWWDSSPYYEEDAWYDVTEWLDGNDFNPTDESTWQESSYAHDDYDPYGGFDDEIVEDDWFYDYYDDGYVLYDDFDDTAFRHSYRYYDWDEDGYYDAVGFYEDSDLDGWYEDYEYLSFADEGELADAREEHAKSWPGEAGAKKEGEKSASSELHRVSGTIRKTKKVDVRDQERLVVRIETSDGTQQAIDLGSAAERMDREWNEGQELEAHGPMLKVGDESILLAKRVVVDGKSHEIDRSQREVSGTVVGTRKPKVHGEERMLAALDPGGGEATWLLDLGPADELEAEIQQGDSITAEGVPCRKGDVRLLMVTTLRPDAAASEIEIDRHATMRAAFSPDEEPKGEKQQEGEKP